MRLEKLLMRGFKTFAEKTELEFGPGITAIVGPNGVGKSNLADAVLWVLGEQGYRALRVESAEDVIFAGAEGRRALGMADVTLTLDNSDRTLACEYSEVEISRRLFRTGKSEYLLNRNPVRLRDIRDLLVDSGLGSDSYALIGQGEVEAILSVRPEDRRELLEEVAGVRKYRLQRTEAERKLGRTEDNLVRIRDIIFELRSQREPLEQQAEVARNYRELAGRLNDLQRDLLAAEYASRHTQRGAVLNDIAIAQADLEATRSQLSALETEYEQASTQVAQLADQLDELRQQAAEAERELDRRRNAEALAEEKLRSVGERRGQLSQALKQSELRLRELTKSLNQVRQTQSRHQAALEAEKRKVEQLYASHQEQEAEYRRAMASREALQDQRGELSGELAKVENEVAVLRGVQAELDERTGRFAQQQEQLNQQRADCEQRLAELREENSTLRAQETELRNRLHATREQHGVLIGTLREHRRKRDQLGEAVAVGESRQGLLAELEQVHEGYAEGPRALLEAAGAGQLTGVEGLLADMLDVPRRLETVVEAGLGDRLQWVLVASEEEAGHCIDYLRDNQLGRATVIATTVSPAGFGAPAAGGVSRSAEGVLGTLDSLVKYPRRLNQVLGKLLGNVLVIEDLEVITRIRHMLSGPVQLVTLNGEVIGPLGEITGGNLDEGVQRSFDRKRELSELEENLQGLRHYLAQMWEAEEDLERQDQELAACAHDLEQQVSETGKQVMSLESQLGHTADRFRAAKAAYEEVTEEIGVLGERRQGADARSAEVERQQMGLAHELDEISGQLVGLPGEQVAAQRLEKQREKLTAARVNVAELEEKLRSAQLLADQQEQEHSRVEQEVKNYRTQLVQLDQIEQEAREGLALGESDTTDLEEQANAQRELAESRRAEVSRLRHAISELEVARHKLVDQREQQSEQFHRLELRQARHDAELVHIVEELEEVYELTPEQALAHGAEDFNLRAARREAKELKQKIRALGYVNVSAIEECERLRDREDYLSGQLEDLKLARDDLEQLIAQIDQTAKDVFLASFAQVAEAFDDLFKQLFEGGSTRLELTNAEAPLDGGVEVIVQQPGRRFQNLIALSGGEKAMTGLALLFAMIQVKPAPFCFLDEIDAALDSANSRRFGQILQDFARDSQFIIITHNPETMEIADVLHGVTMAQPGVSRLISVELAEAQREAEQWAASEADQDASRVADAQSASVK